jgi:uncharacterized membrane protein
MSIPKLFAIGAALAYLVRRKRAAVIRKTITVPAPIDRVFDVWSRLDNFPLLLEHVRSVIVIGKRALWRVEGPHGKLVEFESEVTKLEPDRVIEWQSASKHPGHHGRVRFEEIEGGTLVHVEMT